MSYPSAIVAIVAILAWVWLRTRRGSSDPSLAQPPEVPGANLALEREVFELRKRVEVLERILTDRHDASRLAQDIEALRE